MKRPEEKILLKQEVVAIVACLLTLTVAVGVLIHYFTSQLKEYVILDQSPVVKVTDPSDWIIKDQSGEVATVPLERVPLLEESEYIVTEIERAEDLTSPAPKDSKVRVLSLTDEEIYTLATALWLEGRGESTECQLGIGSVILNRMTTRGMTLNEVLYEYTNGFYQFSVAPYISSSSPNDMTLASAEELVTNGPSMPLCVTYFRAGYYHDWSDLILPYVNIDNTYFSHDIRLCENEGGCRYE